MEIKGYITNLGKYNEGELVGKWITFPIDEEELNDVYREIGINHEDENGEEVITGYEEIFFTDWETDFENDFGEYESIERINEIAEALENWDAETFAAACEVWGVDEVLENTADDYILHCDINNDYDIGYYWLEESGCYDLNKMGNLRYYIDYEAFGRDIRLESNNGFTSQGWIEYVG